MSPIITPGGGGSGGSPPTLSVTRVGGSQPFAPCIIQDVYLRASNGSVTQGVAALGIQLPSDATALTFANLAALPGNEFHLTSPSLTTLSLPALVSVGGDFSPSNMPALTTLSLPALVSVGGALDPTNMPSLTTLSLPALVSVGGDCSPGNMPALTTFSLPALVSVSGGFGPYSMPALTTLSLPALASVGVDFALFGAALTQATVDALLVSLAALDGTGGTTSYANHTVNLAGGTSSTPGAPGLAAKATLEGRGNTVVVN